MDTHTPQPTGPSLRNKVLAALLAGAFVAAVAVVALAGGGDGTPVDAGEAAPAAPAGTPAPGLAFTTFDGATATLADYEGRPLVVNFWASWCPSCIAEMSAAFRPVQEQLGDEVAFLGMNIQDDRSAALRLVAETGVEFDLAEDPRGDLYQALGGLGMPFTVFISADGLVVAEHNGPLTEGQLADRIEAAFGAA